MRAGINAMQIELSQRAQELIRRQLESGAFESPDELVERALDFYDHHQPTMESLKAQIQEGLDDVAAGRVGPLDVEDLKRRGRERLAAF